MKESVTKNKIKEFRMQKGLSQEELALESGLSLSTIQRLEYGKTVPRGYTIKRLAKALDLSQDELLNNNIDKNRAIKLGIVLSAMSFLVAPFLAVLAPLIVYIFKKENVNEIKAVAKELIVFEIFWLLALLIVLLIKSVTLAEQIAENGIMSYKVQPGHLFSLSAFSILYFLNIAILLINAFRIDKGKQCFFLPKFKS